VAIARIWRNLSCLEQTYAEATREYEATLALSRQERAVMDRLFLARLALDAGESGLEKVADEGGVFTGRNDLKDLLAKFVGRLRRIGLRPALHLKAADQQPVERADAPVERGALLGQDNGSASRISDKAALALKGAGHGVHELLGHAGRVLSSWLQRGASLASRKGTGR
jgi:hypothetical protein